MFTGKTATLKDPEHKFLIAAAALMLGMSGALAQDVDAGATTFKVCTPCHDVGETAKNKIGPLLNGLEGRKTGTVTGYNYSDSNKNSGIVWDEALSYSLSHLLRRFATLHRP
jgi:cytochrome c